MGSKTQKSVWGPDVEQNESFLTTAPEPGRMWAIGKYLLNLPSHRMHKTINIHVLRIKIKCGPDSVFF